ncbi:NADP-dependent oxidoreductase [Sodalis sp. RH22]|uniref:NADP-dependent oxidoreductase n=1 Tax=unclassified Sodalis (in: enterobacteria) TaxID=2636512 RepID=UPI0039B4A7DA
MNHIRALVLNEYGGTAAVGISSVVAPTAGAGQVLVRVQAAGVNGLDWKVREGYVRDAFPLQLPTVLGIELAGVVEAAGPGVTRLRKGDRVMGPLGGLGAYADLVAVSEANLSPVPDSLSFVEAAALPVASVAAWQSLNFAGPIGSGQRILIQGAAGGLGGFAVQYAHQAGAVVYATALGSHADYVRGLGANQVIAYDKEQFEATASDIDLVLDYIGGEVLNRSWSVLAEDGVIVSTASPAILASTPAGRRGLWFMNTPDAARLQAIAEDVARGRLQSRIGAVVSFGELPAAIERNRTQPQVGKTVVDFSL